MLKKIYVISIIVGFSLASALQCVIFPVQASQAANAYYAKVERSGVYFYTEPNDEKFMFELPQSYFVLLKNNASELFYTATFNDLSGYVKKTDVLPMQGTPSNPYPSASCRIFAPEGLRMYRAPTNSPTDALLLVPYLANTITYYGRIVGEAAIPNKSNMWYYCKYINQNQTQKGYLYSVFCDELTEIPLNHETFSIITTELFPESSSNGMKSTGLSDVAKTCIILGVSLPCACVLYLLIKPTFAGSTAKAHKKIPRKKRHGDYFEFDENDLN